MQWDIIFVLSLICSGDVRRALELLRRAVEIGRAEHLRSTAEARHKAAAAAKQPQPQDSDVVVEWSEGSGPLVRTQHVTQAAQEMFSALHLQLLRSRSQWEKVLLVAVVVEARATGRSAVVMQVCSVWQRCAATVLYGCRSPVLHCPLCVCVDSIMPGMGTGLLMPATQSHRAVSMSVRSLLPSTASHPPVACSSQQATSCASTTPGPIQTATATHGYASCAAMLYAERC